MSVADRRSIKQAHEQFHVANFLKWLNSTYRTDYVVVAEPDPPEAIIRSSRRTRWVEVTTAFLNSEFAQDVVSYATPGEEHKSIDGKLIVGPDEQFAHSFVDVVKKKLQKRTYAKFAQDYGPGFLIVPIHNPLFDQTTFDFMKRIWAETRVNDLGYFSSVRFAYRFGYDWKLHLWPRTGHLT